MSSHSLAGSHIDGPPSSSVQYVNANSPQSAITVSGQGDQQQQHSHLQSTPADELHDLICVGFGPASLAIAVALHDAIENGKLSKSRAPKVLFLEKQGQFAWHAGMLLPGAKMQISFIKDMASLRDPRSHFTFLNFLHRRGRLIDFTNLSTFLPARVEYEEYLRWCANHFGDVVRYGQEAVSVSPVSESAKGNPVSQFTVSSRNTATGNVSTYRAKNVLLAIGGQASIPKSLPTNHPRVIHSSQYAHLVPKILNQRDAPYRVAVIGGGQSAAEIFNNVQNLYPNSRTYLVMRSEFLKPSDDSPFVNSIFNPEFIDNLYPRSTEYRNALISDARATNYGVVRLELIEHLYERMYEQRRTFGSDERKWPHRILGATDIVGTEANDINQEKLRLRVKSLRDNAASTAESVFDVDLIIAATGYQRKAHLTMMNEGVAELLPDFGNSAASETNGTTQVKMDVKTKGSGIEQKNVRVARDYSVQFAPGKVAPGSGIWLQGCNETTHGLSDTLLSVLACRSDEIVDSIFATGFPKKLSKL
ncbi:putative L-ornithine N(5)-monooxygenase [Seiridium cardinale]|uniref:L-ornithine N(5)-monooxygenase [NAD(P)H] n=1 Tax=Seiridium cardinale TaxID=138064 RepID=A0ABR2XJA1_9PEZI